MSLRSNLRAHWVDKLTVWAFAGLAAAAVAGAGCSTSPPLRPDGLPLVPRYTNEIQLEWMLSGYQQGAERAMTSGQVVGLLDDACLGWERVVFDLESARRYPSRLRMSTESSNLAQLTLSYPEIVRRHPRPAACESLSPTAEAGTAKDRSAAARERELLGRLRAAVGMTFDGSAAAAPTAPAAAAPVPAQAQAQAQTPVPASDTSAASTPAPAAEGAGAAPASVTATAASSGPTPVPMPEPATGPSVDLAALNELAQSDIPAIRLRARYHLLGQCVLAVEASDRAWLAPGSPTSGPNQCSGETSREPRRIAQRRLVKSMLQAWRGRHTEPMSDLVIALANFAARDNPILQSTNSIAR